MFKSYINDSEVIALLKRDGAKLSTNVELFARENKFQVKLLLNLWGVMLDEVDPRNASTLFNVLLPKHGLVGTIALCAQVADLVIDSLEYGDPFFHVSMTVDGTKYRHDEFVFAFCHTDDIGEQLQMLRFPKRFSPLQADKVARKTMADFFQLQNLAKVRNRSANWNSPIIRGVREWAEYVLKGYKPMRNRGFAVLQNGYFSDGDAANTDRGDKSLSNKLLHSSIKCILHPMYPMEVNLPRKNFIPRNWRKGDTVSVTCYDRVAAPFPDITFRMYNDVSILNTHSCEVQAVPKNYKSARIIAKEEPFRNYAMTAVRRELLARLKVNCAAMSGGWWIPYNEERQEPNQICAFLGSQMAEDESYSTIDLSSASDTICVALARAVLPRELYRDIQTYRSQFVADRLGQDWFEISRNHIWLTSGCTVTFGSMVAILLAAALYAYDQYSIFTTGENYYDGVELGNTLDLNPPYIYGDDCIVDDRVFDTFCDIVTRLGFKVNEGKSFGPETRYRESCGVEFFEGRELTSAYWPRQSLVDPSLHKESTATTYAAVVDLQHKFYDSIGSRTLLEEVALKCIGRSAASDLRSQRGCNDITYCTPMESHNCLWGDLPLPIVRHDEKYDVDTDIDANYYNVVGSNSGRVPKDLHSNPRYQNYLMWKYVEYLREGPSYPDELSRLLGVTQSRIRPGDFGGGRPVVMAVKDI